MTKNITGSHDHPTGFSSDYMRESRRINGRGRCLHFDAGSRCDKIISAHSIQRKNQLALIAEDGHVYRLNVDPSLLRKTNGVPYLKKSGIKTVSTFGGFCKRHDNTLFHLIDNAVLMPNERQVALYAYRSLCRELFVKENAVLTLNKFKGDPRLNSHRQAFFEACHDGNSMGLDWLNHHKKLYDDTISSERFDEFRYVCFVSSSQCPLVLSGLIYPDFDFEGDFLQHLGIEQDPLDLLTFFTAPADRGWAFCFAWHESSSRSCLPFIGSLANKIGSGQRIEDILLRFSLTCCENHAIRISWWESLADDAKHELIQRMHMMVLPDVLVPHDYLARGCDGIASWTFEVVFESLKKKI